MAPIAPREILGDIDGGKVLDVATGAGGFLRFLIEGLRGYDSVHLAAAQNIPVVAIYGPTNPQRNGPYGPQGPNGGRIVVLRSPESQTSHARRADPESGLLQITVDDVFSAACRLIGGCS